MTGGKPLAIVKYRFRRPGSLAWVSTAWSGRTRQPLEALALQELRRQRPGAEIEIIELHWR